MNQLNLPSKSTNEAIKDKSSSTLSDLEEYPFKETIDNDEDEFLEDERSRKPKGKRLLKFKLRI